MENKALFSLVRKILLQEEQVAIPGFGGFVMVYEPSAIKQDDPKIYGPKRKVSFNPSLQQDEGILADAVSKEANLSEEKTAEEIKLFVQHLDKQLNSNKEVVFEGIGRLSIDEKGGQVFEAVENEEINADTYGLSPEVAPEEKLRTTAGRKKPVPASKTRKSKPGKSPKYLLYIGAPAILVVAVLAFGYFQDWFYAEEKPMILGTVEQSERQQEVKKPEVTSTTNTEEIKSNTVKEETSEAAADQIQEQLVPQGSFYIIAGSFKARQNALQKMESLSGKGYQCEIHSVDNGYYRVSIGSYKTKEEALNVLTRLKKGMSDIWLWNKS